MDQALTQTETPRLVLRTLADADAPALHALAGRDSAAVPAAPVLAAERDGRLVAAVSLLDGSAIADPFLRSATTLEIVRRHAAEIGIGDSATTRSRPARRATVVPALGG